VIVYDVTSGSLRVIGRSFPDRTSFTNTAKWVDDVRNERGQDVIIVLVGNKTDLNDKRCVLSLRTVLTPSQVTPEDLDKRAKELGVMSIETSAKAGHNVKTLFKKIAMALPGGAEVKDATANQSESCGELSQRVPTDLPEIDVSTKGEEAPDAGGCSC